MGAEFGRMWAKPEQRAMVAGYLTTAALLATRRMPFLLYFGCCWAGAYATRMAYRAAQDLHTLAAEAAEAANDRAWAAEIAQLTYCGPDCPGHTMGAPGESCMRRADEPKPAD